MILTILNHTPPPRQPRHPLKQTQQNLTRKPHETPNKIAGGGESNNLLCKKNVYVNKCHTVHILHPLIEILTRDYCFCLSRDIHHEKLHFVIRRNSTDDVKCIDEYSC